MNKKKEASEFLANSKGLNKTRNLSVHHINTPFRIRQFNFSGKTEIFTKPEKERRGRSRCYHCLQWVKHPAGFGLWARQNAPSVQYALCKKCWDSRLILTPGSQRSFGEKCERNLQKALGGGVG